MVMSWIWTGIVLISILCALVLGNGGALLPSYTNGFYTCRDADVFVTRGLGGMVRILNRPEVAVVILRRN